MVRWTHKLSWVFSYQCDACSNYHRDKWARQTGGMFIRWEEKKRVETAKKGNVDKRKMSEGRDGSKITTHRNSVDVAMTEWEKWLFVADGGSFLIFSYVTVSHPSERPKIVFSPNDMQDVSPLSHFLFNSNNEQQSEDEQQKVEELLKSLGVCNRNWHIMRSTERESRFNNCWAWNHQGYVYVIEGCSSYWSHSISSSDSLSAAVVIVLFTCRFSVSENVNTSTSVCVMHVEWHQ